MRHVIEGQTRANAEAVKWYLSLNMNFCKSASPAVKTDPVVTFCSEVFKSINSQELNYQFHVGYNQILLQIDAFQRNGSGWVADHLQHLDLGTCFLCFWFFKFTSFVLWCNYFSLVCHFFSQVCHFFITSFYCFCH